MGAQINGDSGHGVGGEGVRGEHEGSDGGEGGSIAGMDGYGGGVEIDDPDLADAVGGVDGQLHGKVAAASGIGEDFDYDIGSAGNAATIRVEDVSPGVGHEQQVGLR